MSSVQSSSLERRLSGAMLPVESLDGYVCRAPDGPVSREEMVSLLTTPHFPVAIAGMIADYCNPPYHGTVGHILNGSSHQVQQAVETLFASWGCDAQPSRYAAQEFCEAIIRTRLTLMYNESDNRTFLTGLVHMLYSFVRGRHPRLYLGYGSRTVIIPEVLRPFVYAFTIEDLRQDKITSTCLTFKRFRESHSKQVPDDKENNFPQSYQDGDQAIREEMSSALQRLRLRGSDDQAVYYTIEREFPWSDVATDTMAFWKKLMAEHAKSSEGQLETKSTAPKSDKSTTS